MGIKNPLALVPGWQIYMTMIILGISAGLPADARVYSTWVEPGRHPFTGTPDQACSLLAVATPLMKTECLEGISCIEAGRGSLYTLRDGEVVTTVMTDSAGNHSAPTMIVGFTDDTDRVATACSAGRTGDLQLLKVHACRNWTVASVPAPPPVERRISRSKRVESPRRFIPGAAIPNCCPACGGGYRLVTPGVTLDPNTQSPVNSGSTQYNVRP